MICCVDKNKVSLSVHKHNFSVFMHIIRRLQLFMRRVTDDRRNCCCSSYLYTRIWFISFGVSIKKRVLLSIPFKTLSFFFVLNEKLKVTTELCGLCPSDGTLLEKFSEISGSKREIIFSLHSTVANHNLSESLAR